MSELPLNKYLTLQQNNQNIHEILKNLAVNRDEVTFKTIAESTLSISSDEALNLYKQVLCLNTSTITPSLSTSTVVSNVNSVEPFPTISLSQTPVCNANIQLKDAFKSIKQSDNYMNKRIKTNIFKQHPRLKSIFQIPLSTENIHEETHNKIAAIKEMQLQYEEGKNADRLSEIPETKLRSEFVLRVNVIDVIKQIKAGYDELTTTIKNEMTNNAYLQLLLSRNRKNRQKTYNTMTAQHEIQSIYNKAKNLLSQIKEIKIQTEYYVMDRQLIFKTDAEYQARINPWRNKLTDAGVTNFFLAVLNKFKITIDEIGRLLPQLTLHLQQNKYTIHIGSLEDIQNGWNERERVNEQRRVMYVNVCAIKTKYKQYKLKDSVIEKQLKINNNDITKTISALINLNLIKTQNDNDIADIINNANNKSDNKSKNEKRKKDNKNIKRKRKTNEEKGLQKLDLFWNVNRNHNRKRNIDQIDTNDSNINEPQHKKRRLNVLS